MKYKIFISILLVISILFTSAPINNAAKSENSKDKKSYIIKYKNAEKGKKKLKEIGIKENKSFKHMTAATVILDGASVEELRKDPNIEFIEPDYTFDIATTINEIPDYHTEIGIVHEQNHTIGSGVKVAILDTGVKSNDELSLKGGASFIDNTVFNQDDNGHGTFVASILASRWNEKGIVGVAPDVDLYSLKVMNSAGKGSYSAVIEALEWAIDNKIDIVSMSFSGQQYSLALAEEMDKALQSGILLVAAAGNDGQNSISYPAKFNSVIAVGAVDEQFHKANFSNTGNELGLVARGTNVAGLNLDGSVGAENGTSFAVPQVTGIAAAYLSQFPNLSVSELSEMLKATARHLGEQDQYGYGLSTYKVENTDEGPSEPVEETPEEPSDIPEEELPEDSSEKLQRHREMIEFERSIQSDQSSQREQTLLNKSHLVEEFGVSDEYVQEQLDKGLTLEDLFTQLWNEKESKPKSDLDDLSLATVESINNSKNKEGTVTSDFPADMDLKLFNQFREPSDESENVSAAEDIPEEEIVRPTIQTNTAPYQVALHNEDVSLLSGALSISEDDFTLPGRNGMSFTLSRTYNSDASQLYQSDVTSHAHYLYEVAFKYKQMISRQSYTLTRYYNKTLTKKICSTGAVVWTDASTQISKPGGTYGTISQLDSAIKNPPSLENETVHACGSQEKDRAYYYSYSYSSNTFTINHSAYVDNGEYDAAFGPYQTMAEAQTVKNGIVSGSLIESGRLGNETEGYVNYELRYSNSGTINSFVDSVSSSNLLNDDPMDKRFPIGKGWIWNIPYVTSEFGNKYVSLGDGSSYEIKGTELKNYPWSDLSFLADTTVTYNGVSSANVLKSADGINQYFDASGNLIEIKDKYDNFIGFSYSTDPQYGKVLTKITDVIGNSINIKYTTDEVIITKDDRTVTYQKSKTTGNKELLLAVIDPAGRKTSYDYAVRSAKFNYLGTTPITDNPYALLTHVYHPTGAETAYDYEVNPVKRYASSSQVYEAYRLASRNDLVTYSDNSVEKYNSSSLVYSGDMASSYGSDTTFNTTLFDGLLESTSTYKKDYISTDAGTDYYQTKSTVSDGLQSRIVEYTYDEEKRRTSPISTKSYTTNKLTGNSSVSLVSSVIFDDYQNVLSTTNPLGATSTFTYDGTWHTLLTSNEPVKEGQSLYSTFSLNAKGDVQDLTLRDSGPNGSVLRQTQYEYDDHGNVKVINEKDKEMDVITTIEYSVDYNAAYPTKLSQPYTDVDGNSHTKVVHATYNKSTGTVASFTDSNGNESKYEYDALDRTVKVTNPDGSIVQQIIDDTNNEMKYINETGVTNYVKWNALGLQIDAGYIINGEFQSKVKQGYDQFGRKTWSEDAAGSRTALTYDNWNRVVATTLPNNIQSTTDYDDINLVIVETDAEGNKVRKTMDKMGRVLRSEQTRNGELYTDQTKMYDYAGNVVELQDGKNAITQYVYNPLNELLSIHQADSKIINYRYNQLGQQTSILYPDGTSDEKAYDELGNLVRSTDPLLQSTINYYDGNGNLIKSVDAKGQQYQYTYSSRDLLLKKQGPTETISFTYDLAGLRKSMTDSTGITSYISKDETGELSSIQFPDGKKINYNYDVNGNRSTMISPFGSVVNYAYNSLNQLTSVTSNGQEEVSYEYYKNGLLKNEHQANGTDSIFAYNGLSLKTLQHKSQDGTTLNSYEYSYDNNSNILTATTNGVTQNYTYDTANRISTSSENEESYTYDAKGNRSTQETNSILINHMAEDTDYSYDEWNQLTKAKKGSKEITYKYNGDHLLVERTENNVSTRYYYDGTDIIAEGKVGSDGKVTLTKSYVRGNGLVTQSDQTGVKGYYLKNGHGDIVNIADKDGQILNTYAYDLWGNTTSETELISNPFRYSGEYLDSSLELQYLRSRWYDPSIGRFISKDSYEGDIQNPLSLNRYTYVENNPLIYIDPLGNHKVLWKNVQGYRVVDKILLDEPSWITKAISNYNKGSKKGNLVGELAEELGEFASQKAASKYVWKLSPTERGKNIEAYLAVTDYEDWDYVGALLNGYFPVIDFYDNNNTVVSLKTMDTDSASYADDKLMYTQLSMYVQNLKDAMIYVDGEYVPYKNRILDIRVKPGQKKDIDIKYLKQYARSNGIVINVREF